MYQIKEYYMVCNEKGSAYGAFESYEDALESLNTHDFLNNDDDYNSIERIIELSETVYKL